ncbi:MAG: hypothetical protein J5974_11140, partial [Pyramidobacter sp.]|nr:hypothetical protein [Pyramidobacter sp.]
LPYRHNCLYSTVKAPDRRYFGAKGPLEVVFSLDFQILYLKVTDSLRFVDINQRFPKKTAFQKRGAHASEPPLSIPL